MLNRLEFCLFSRTVCVSLCLLRFGETHVQSLFIGLEFFNPLVFLIEEILRSIQFTSQTFCLFEKFFPFFSQFPIFIRITFIFSVYRFVMV
ncbi:hypothetical protein A4G99_23520 [Haladaptatus sp. R4]|nr:hypothetical protein A4G99_23520 [Haladaptatus sp. R4]